MIPRYKNVFTLENGTHALHYIMKYEYTFASPLIPKADRPKTDFSIRAKTLQDDNN